jgi:hypothetical protein
MNGTDVQRALDQAVPEIDANIGRTTVTASSHLIEAAFVIHLPPPLADPPVLPPRTLPFSGQPHVKTPRGQARMPQPTHANPAAAKASTLMNHVRSCKWSSWIGHTTAKSARTLNYPPGVNAPRVRFAD